MEPGILYAPWLQQWENILHHLPQNIVGLSINADSVLITGNLESVAQRTALESRLASVFSDSRLLNWTTAALDAAPASAVTVDPPVPLDDVPPDMPPAPDHMPPDPTP